MTTQTVRTVDVPRPAGGELDPAAHWARRRALDVLRALDAVGEPCTYRVVMPDGTAVPPDQVTDHDSTDVVSDLEHLGTTAPLSLDALLRMLYAASSHHDRSRIAPALDRLLDYVDHWSAVAPERVSGLFERLAPSRIVRAVGQTLLASTRLTCNRSAAHREFLSRFLEDLRARGTPEATIARLREGIRDVSTGPRARVQWFRGADADLVAAVWLTRRSATQLHAGLYHRDHGAARILHFAWDLDLREDDPGDVFEVDDHGLIALSLDDDDAQALSALCRRVARRHAVTLRFRFVEWQPRFDLTTAEIVPPVTDPRYGFTCTTFVLALLRSAVVDELLALDQWPAPTPDGTDDRWQKKVAKMLCSSAASPADTASVLSGIGARRVLPTDVAGGAMHSRERWPVGFVDSRREGDQIAARLP